MKAVDQNPPGGSFFRSVFHPAFRPSIRLDCEGSGLVDIPHSARGKNGFTLLEVMIALAVLALVGVAFLRAQAGSVRLVDESSQISLATLLAREKMAELEGLGFPEVGKKEGTGGGSHPRFRWEQAVTATDFPALRQGLVRVLWKDGSRERTLELTAYFAQK